MKGFLSILLSVLLLAGSTGITIATHFCAGHAVKSKVQLGHTDLDCGMNMDSECPSDNSSDYILKSDNCCENHFQSIEADEMIKAQMAFKAVNLPFFIAFAYTLFDLITPEEQLPVLAGEYAPPILAQDIPVLYQSFLL